MISETRPTVGWLAGVLRGLSAGGRLFGYRAVPQPSEIPATKRTLPARYEIDPNEAAVVRRIFRDYAHGRSMRTIAHMLNSQGVPFPAKATKRGPARRGWAASTVRVILRNKKYAGLWTWNKTRFLKDPDTGRRRSLPRQSEEWIRQERPELRIIEPDLWAAVQARLKFVEAALGGQAPRGRAAVAYSPYLLSGLLRCGVCNARMVAQTATRRKGSGIPSARRRRS